MKTSACLRSLALSAVCLSQTGCAVVGYSSNAGWFFWPGGWIGVAIMVAVAAMGMIFWRQ